MFKRAIYCRIEVKPDIANESKQLQKNKKIVMIQQCLSFPILFSVTYLEHIMIILSYIFSNKLFCCLRITSYAQRKLISNSHGYSLFIYLYVLFTFRRVALFANDEEKTKLEPEVASRKSFEESNTKYRILSQIRSHQIKSRYRSMVL